MEVRRKFINECKGQPKLQKALALALYMKHCFGRSSMVSDYSINKLHTITGVSATTLKKYLPVIREHGWLKYEGKCNNHLEICHLSSHSKGRNIKVDRFCFKSFKDVYRSLRAFLALIIQSRKDFIKRTIQIATDPKRGQNFKAARKFMKRLVRKGSLRSIYDEYKELGLGYKRIAKETGNCVKTAQNTMKYAIKHGWVKKETRFKRVFSPNYRVEGSNFYKNGFSYFILSNVYNINKSISKELQTCPISGGKFIDGKK
jgi:hypothetical protein